MRKNLIFAALALAGLATLGFTPTRHDNSYTTNGVTYAQRGGLGSADYVVTNVDADAVGRVKSVNGKMGVVTLSASDVNALPDDEQGLGDNLNFSNAVIAVSPPVELPDKWALGNVTNATGGAVSAVDVGAPSRAEVEAGWWSEWVVRNHGSIITNAEIVYFPATEYWEAHVDGDFVDGVNGSADATYLEFSESGRYLLTATRHRVAAPVPTKPSDVGALPDDEQGLKDNSNFSNAVVAVSPPVELPQKWALANVTNASGNAVGATDVGALAKTDITHDDWSSARGYHKGDIVRRNGRTYRALSNIPPDLAWADFLWEEVTDVKTAMTGALYRNYLALGELGTNTVGGVETDPEAADYIAITTGDRNNDGIVDSVFWMTPTEFGNKIGRSENGWRFSDSGHIYFKTASTNFLANILDFFTPLDIRGIESPYTDYAYRTSFVTSPYYVYAYLAGNYETATTAGGKYLQQSVAADTYLTQTDAANTYASIAALAAATGAITRVYGDEGYTNYIDGLRGVYTQPPPTVAFSNSYGNVFMPVSDATDTWRCMVGGVTNDLLWINFKWILRRGGSNVGMGVPANYSANEIMFNDGGTTLTFYRMGIPAEWQRVGTLALESWVGDAITAATNGFVKAEDIDLSDYATTGSLATVKATIPNNITRSAVDATLVHCDSGNCTNALVTIQQATDSLAGLMTAQDKIALGEKAPLNSPAFTGLPTAPTAESGDNSTRLATTAFVQDAIGSSSSNPLSGQSFDFATMQGVFNGVKACIEALGGSVTNFPANN